MLYNQRLDRPINDSFSQARVICYVRVLREVVFQPMLVREKIFCAKKCGFKSRCLLDEGNNSETARSPHFNTTKSYFLAPLMYVEQFH